MIVNCRRLRIGAFVILSTILSAQNAVAQNPFSDLLNAVDSLQDLLEKKPDGGGKVIGDANTTEQRLTILKTYNDRNGDSCREYKREILVQNPVTVFGRACRHSDGAWMIKQESLSPKLSDQVVEKKWTALVARVASKPATASASNSTTMYVNDVAKNDKRAKIDTSISKSFRVDMHLKAINGVEFSSSEYCEMKPS